MAYDIKPLQTLKEKERMLTEAVDNGYILFFEHDPLYECATLERNDRGRIVVKETFDLKDVI
jgi:hypothetical protein